MSNRTAKYKQESKHKSELDVQTPESEIPEYLFWPQRRLWRHHKYVHAIWFTLYEMFVPRKIVTTKVLSSIYGVCKDVHEWTGNSDLIQIQVWNSVAALKKKNLREKNSQPECKDLMSLFIWRNFIETIEHLFFVIRLYGPGFWKGPDINPKTWALIHCNAKSWNIPYVAI
jgi:hypothetical protein